MQFRTAACVYTCISIYTQIGAVHMIIQCIFKTELFVTNLKFCSESSLLENSWEFLSFGSNYGQTFAHQTLLFTLS